MNYALISIVSGVIILVLFIITIIRVLLNPPKLPEKANGLAISVDQNRIARNLAGAIRINTSIYDDSRLVKWKEFKTFHSYLEKTYPLIHKNLTRETVNQYSLVYRWKNPGATRNPILLIAHIDVVPAEEGRDSLWTKAPFSEEISDGFIWGRGAIDIKNQLIANMEAIEYALNQGWSPNRDIYLAFGHDEEIRGAEGAQKIAEKFSDEGIRFDLVLDEGGIISEGVLKGVDTPFAMVGIAEKGYVNLELFCENNGGHSSMPPQKTALGRICRGASRIERRQPGLRLSKPVKEMFRSMGPFLPGIQRYFAANLWLFAPLFKAVFAKSQEGNAMLRTTTAVTMAKGSAAPNILPQRASGIINFRLLPGDSVDKLICRATATVKDKNIRITPVVGDEPSRVSNIDGKAFRKFNKTMSQIFPRIPVVPYLVTGGTDSRKYDRLCDCVLRFSPFKLNKEELGRMHGSDERIAVENMERGVRFLIQLIYNFCVE